MDFLLKQELIQLRIFAAVSVPDEIVEVLSDKKEAMFWALLESKGIVNVQDRDDEASIFFRHVLHQVFDLQELANSDLNTLICVLEVVIDEEQLFLLGVFTAQLDLKSDTVEQRVLVAHGLFTFIMHNYNLSRSLSEL